MTRVRREGAWVRKALTDAVSARSGFWLARRSRLLAARGVRTPVACYDAPAREIVSPWIAGTSGPNILRREGRDAAGGGPAIDLDLPHRDVPPAPPPSGPLARRAPADRARQQPAKCAARPRAAAEIPCHVIEPSPVHPVSPPPPAVRPTDRRAAGPPPASSLSAAPVRSSSP